MKHTHSHTTGTLLYLWLFFVCEVIAARVVLFVNVLLIVHSDFIYFTFPSFLLPSFLFASSISSLFLVELGEFDCTDSVGNTNLKGLHLQRFVGALVDVECVLGRAVGLLELMHLNGRLSAVSVLAEGLRRHRLGFTINCDALVGWLRQDNCIMASNIDKLVVVAVLHGADRRQRPFGLPSVLVHVRHGQRGQVILVVVEQSHDGRVVGELRVLSSAVQDVAVAAAVLYRHFF